ncbi:MAG: FAD-dependent oxidoreductase [Nostocoides sp.]
MASVSVVGGGVIGLTTALELARVAHVVRCFRDRDVEDTVSRVAGGLWYPYHVEPRDRAVRWGLESLVRFTEIAAAEPFEVTGVRLATGVLVHREEPDLWWTAGVKDVRPARTDELPCGVLRGTVATLPLIDTGRYLPWLEHQCARAGVEFVDRHIGVIDDLPPGDVVVVACGLRSGALTGDTDLSPARGQVVRLANPGLTDWLVDGDDPTRLTYVLPHGETVVCGGTDVPGDWNVEVDPLTEEAVLARCIAAVPALAGAPVVGRAVGLRPVAPAVRLERHTDGGRTIVSNYGHGGAGVTLSWGCADEVARLVR